MRIEALQLDLIPTLAPSDHEHVVAAWWGAVTVPVTGAHPDRLYVRVEEVIANGVHYRVLLSYGPVRVESDYQPLDEAWEQVVEEAKEGAPKLYAALQAARELRLQRKAVRDDEG
jgi:hypothetical protein